LTFDEGLTLFREATVLEAGGAADAVRRVKHPVDRVTYQVDRNVNYTNVCVYRCSFCAFYRPAGDAEGYVLPFEEIGRKVEETIALGGTGILLQGGVHAELPFSFYEELLSFLREKYPHVHRHAFSAPEIYFLAKKEKTSVADFIPWTFQEENTAMDGTVETAGGYDYLRTLAIARLYLDNVPHVQGSW